MRVTRPGPRGAEAPPRLKKRRWAFDESPPTLRKAYEAHAPRRTFHSYMFGGISNSLIHLMQLEMTPPTTIPGKGREGANKIGESRSSAPHSKECLAQEQLRLGSMLADLHHTARMLKQPKGTETPTRWGVPPSVLEDTSRG